MKSKLVIIVFAMLFYIISCGTDHYEKTVFMYNAKQYQEIIDYVKQNIKGDTDNAVDMFDVHRHVMMSYKNLGRLPEGLNYYMQFDNKALKLYIMGLYNAFNDINRTAIKLYKQVLELRPKEYIVYYDLSLSYIKIGKFRRARGSLAKLIKYNDDFGDAYYDLGLIYAYARRKPDVGSAFIKYAIGEYSEAEHVTKIDATIALGKIYQKMGRYKDALSILEDLVDKYFNKIIWSVDMGTLYLKDDEPEKAEKFWKRAIKKLGSYTIRGRFFLKKLYGYKKGIADFTGVPYYYIVSQSDSDIEEIVYANEEEYFFTNPKNKRLYNSFKRRGLIDRRMGYEYWVVEWIRVGKRRLPVYKWLQYRGIVSTLRFKNGRKLYISVKQRKIAKKQTPVRLQKVKTDSKTFWRFENVRAGIYSGKKYIQTINFPIKQFFKAALLDINGDGKEEIILAGIDRRNRLKLSIFTKKRRRWRKLDTLFCGLKNKNNGIVFLGLNNSKLMSLIKYSSIISWADVYTLNRRGFRKNNREFKLFAKDYVKKYAFFTPAYLKRVLYKTEKSKRIIYKKYSAYLPLAEKIALK